MKTTAVDAPQRSGPVRKRKAIAQNDHSFAEHLESSTSSSSGQTPTIGSIVIEGLIGLQEYGDDAANGRQRQALDRGQTILDQLDRLRQDILFGRVPVPRLRELTRLLQNDASRDADPRLREILEEIELRAHVELAKLGETV